MRSRETPTRMRLRRLSGRAVNVEPPEELQARIRPGGRRVRAEPTPRLRLHGRRGRGAGFRPGAWTRLQRSTVKVSYSKNTASRSWAAHGRYLAREGASREGERGLGFDAEREDVELQGLLGDWQRAGDPHVFRVIVSPERGGEVDLQTHVRELIGHMERDLGTRLEWAGIVHTNTGRPHAHLVIRGVRDDGEALTIEARYISEGIRRRSQELLTRELGYRTELDVEQAREAAIERTALTELDRAILRRADARGRVTFQAPEGRAPGRDAYQLQQMRRLRVLESMGLAERAGVRSWTVDSNAEEVLRELGRVHDISKQLARGRALASDPNAPVVFTRLGEGDSLHGRVIGTGLDEGGPEGSRYVLVEGTDGRIHFVPQSPSIERARGEQRMPLESFVSLSGRSFEVEGNRGRGQVNYVAVQVDGAASEVGQVTPPLALDLEVVERVRETGRLPEPTNQRRGFAAEWEARVVARAGELERGGVLQRAKSGAYVVSPDWQAGLDRLRFAGERDRHHDVSAVPSDVLLARVVVRGTRSVLAVDPHRRTHEIPLPDRPRIDAPDRGAELLIALRARGRDVSTRDREAPMQENERTRQHAPDQPRRAAQTRDLRILERLTPAQLEATPHEFARIDQVLAALGEIPTVARGGPALERLRERQELWRRRGVEAGDEFEERARAWLRQREEAEIERALARVRDRHAKPVTPARADPGVEHRGRVVGFAAVRDGRLVLIDTGRQIRALRNDEARLQVGQQVRARGERLEADNERVRRIAWRIDDLEHARRIERDRGR